MAHVTKEELLRASEAGRAEIARMAAHSLGLPLPADLSPPVFLGDRAARRRARCR